MKELSLQDEFSEFLLYTVSNGDVKVEIFFHYKNI